MSRLYGTLMLRFYESGSGYKLRGKVHAQALAPYLFAAPKSNRIGLYHISLAAIADDLGWELDDVRKALDQIIETGIAYYDEAERLLYMPEGARVQMQLKGEHIAKGNKQMNAVIAAVKRAGDHPFVEDFKRRYLLPETLTEYGLTVDQDSKLPPPTAPKKPYGEAPSVLLESPIHTNSKPPVVVVNCSASVPEDARAPEPRPPRPPPPPSPPTPDPPPHELTPEEAELVALVCADKRLGSLLPDPRPIVEDAVSLLLTAGVTIDGLKRSVAAASASVGKKQAAGDPPDGPRAAGILEWAFRDTQRRERKERDRAREDAESDPDARAEQRRAQERADAAAESVPDALSPSETARRAREVLGGRLAPKAARRRPAKKVS